MTHPARIRSLGLTALAGLLALGCGSSEDDPDAGGMAIVTTDLEPMTWSYVPIEGAVCRDGKPTGILVNPSPESDKFLIFLEEGAACFNTFSCSVAFTFDAETEVQSRIDQIEGSHGASNRQSPDNPFADWNLVFVPYCSGDVYAGSASDVQVGAGTYQFRGYDNMTGIFEYVQGMLEAPSQIVLAGTSAGGWGAGYNYPKARRMFPDTEVILIDDSAAYMGNEYLAPCWQKRVRELWNLDETMPEDCEACLQSEDGSFAEQLITWTLDTHPDFRGGLLETAQDEQMRMMLGFGVDDCAQFDAFIPPNYPADRFTDGLRDFRDRVVGDYAQFRVFFDQGNTHGFISHTSYGALVTTYPPRFDAEVQGVSVTEWLQAAVDGGPWDSVSAF